MLCNLILTLFLHAGTCNFACSGGLSCVYGVCTNALVGRRRALKALAGQPYMLAQPEMVAGT